MKETSRRILIKNAFIIDGTGRAGEYGSVLVGGGKILEIAPCIDAPEAVCVDAGGRILAPGFIDMHRHSDFCVLTKRFGQAEIPQGITSVISGVCGMSAFPWNSQMKREYEEYVYPCLGGNVSEQIFRNLEEYQFSVGKQGIPVNTGTFVGAGAVKVSVKGFSAGPFSAAEMELAKTEIREALDQGAFGLSMGIMYTPECYSSAKELAELAAPVRNRGILCTHIRGEGDALVESVEEVLQIARRAEVPLHISHFKAFGVHNWHDSIFRAIDLIEGARKKGEDVTVDFYPYTSGSTILFSIIPPEFQREGKEKALEYLASAEGKKRLAESIYQEREGWDNAVQQLGYDRIVISSVRRPENKKYVGKSILQNCNELGSSRPSDWIADLLVSEEGQAGIRLKSMSQEDVDTVAGLPYSMVISDSLYCLDGLPHPRLYGSFPGFIRQYCREKKLLSKEAAIAKMTGMPAQRIRLKDRGVIRRGAYADLVMFDPERLTDRADYISPEQTAEGMDLVLVNGNAVWENGRIRKTKAGTILKS